MNKNCCNYFLNYLKSHITSIYEFKKFILQPNNYWHTFIYACSEEFLSWFESNVDDDFYKLLVKLQNSPKKEDTCIDRFNYYYTEVLDSKILNEVEFTQEMLIKACKLLTYHEIYPNPAEILLDRIVVLHAQCLETNGNLTVFKVDEIDLKKVVRKSRRGDMKFVFKILNFFMVAYYSDLDDHDSNLLEFEKMEKSFSENNSISQYEIISWFQHNIQYRVGKNEET